MALRRRGLAVGLVRGRAAHRDVAVVPAMENQPHKLAKPTAVRISGRPSEIDVLSDFSKGRDRMKDPDESEGEPVTSLLVSLRDKRNVWVSLTPVCSITAVSSDADCTSHGTRARPRLGAAGGAGMMGGGCLLPPAMITML